RRPRARVTHPRRWHRDGVRGGRGARHGVFWVAGPQCSRPQCPRQQRFEVAMRTGSMRVAEISTAAIRHNVGHIRELTGGVVIVVVKANGYGHGAAIAAQAAIEGGADMVATADLEEALALREAGIAGPILCWLHG